MSTLTLTHVTRANDRWDLLAFRYYGDAFAYAGLIHANPDVPISPLLPEGLVLTIPIIPAAAAAPEGTPPWLL